MFEQAITILIFILVSPLWTVPLVMGIGLLNGSRQYEKLSNAKDGDENHYNRFLIYALEARKISELCFLLFGAALVVLFGGAAVLTIAITSLPK